MYVRTCARACVCVFVRMNNRMCVNIVSFLLERRSLVCVCVRTYA